MSENSQYTVADQSVSICFGELMSAMRASADGLRIRALEALLDREDDKAQACLPAIASIKERQAEIEAAYRKWNGEPTVLASPSAASKPNFLLPPSKRPGSKLRVWLNGQEIDGSNAAETFAHTIEAIGIGRVASLGMTLSGIALVAEAKETGYQKPRFVGGFYLCTHSNNPAKKQILDSIADRLRLSLKATVEER